MNSETVTVLLFARYAELLGTSAVRVPVAQAGTVGTVVDYLRQLPGGGQLPERLLVAVNMRQVGSGQSVSVGDEVAILPPMAGG